MNLFNTLTRTKEPFVPLRADRVTMYVCGVTVYDECHLGHARSAIVFDVLYRYLRSCHDTVTYVRNFTDIDDKIIKRAHDEGRAWTEIVDTYIAAFERDMARLRVCRPTIEPRATEHMPEMIDMIAALMRNGVAYQVEHDVYYRVAEYAEYGRLSHRKQEDMLAGARVEVDERKRDPMDFALWKGAKAGEPGWESPWGMGRPGWHIECSAMAIKHLGQTIDIHGGGKDLVFPHHENEIAQSCGATGVEFARCWVHNGFVTIDEEKMSKSLGNFFTIDQLFRQSTLSESVTAEALRYFLVSTHYRSDLSFSTRAVAEAKVALDHIYGLLQRLEEGAAGDDTVQASQDRDVEASINEFTEHVRQAMDDDLNTPRVLAEFQRFRAAVNRCGAGSLSHERQHRAAYVIREQGALVGLFQVPVDEWEFRPLSFEAPDSPRGRDDDRVSEEWVEQQVVQRNEARKTKDFATADRIRQELAANNITLEDRPDGTTRWKR